MHEWAWNSELTRQTGLKFTSLHKGAIEEAASRKVGWLGRPLVGPAPSSAEPGGSAEPPLPPLDPGFGCTVEMKPQ